jgi:signal transduction histidine kinase
MPGPLITAGPVMYKFGLRKYGCCRYDLHDMAGCMSISVATLFAPAERAEPGAIQVQHRALAADPVIKAVLDCFPEPAMILNQQRQIVFANDKLAILLSRPRASLLGLRPGEALDCVHAAAEPGGCGTTLFCRACGAANAILNSQGSSLPDVQECRVQRAVNGRIVALDLRVWATPLTVAGESFMVVALHDTTDEKRRQVLERIFFHDLLNTAGALSLLLEALPQLPGEEMIEVSQRARRLIAELSEEIQSQRDLAAAERGELTVRPGAVDAGELLRQVCAPYDRRAKLGRQKLVIQQGAKPVVLESDERLLSRVLSNLIKNALEASEPGQTVTVSVNGGDRPTFCVHNESAIPEEVQTQIFQRSFSTKEGTGRGVGTYSVKLLTESYLEGTVEFRSTAADGTTFTVRLPPRLAGSR